MDIARGDRGEDDEAHRAFEVPSRILARRVGVRTYAARHAHRAARLPVVYLHDGQNVFDGQSSAPSGQSWAFDVTLRELVRVGAAAPALVVAVDHAGAGRLDEFTPTRDAAHAIGGGAGRYARFLVEELKPFIDRHLPTEPWTDSTVMIGSSMGGLVTLAAGLQYPGTFGALGVMSPSVWWDHRSILRGVRARVLRPRPRIWLDVGLREPARAIDDARALRKVLVREGWEEPRGLRYDEDPVGEHDEASWGRRVGPMLRFLLPPDRSTRRR